MKKRFFAILLTLVAAFSLTSCGKKYTVTFNSNGGSAVESQEVKKGKKAERPSDPTKSGATFGSWQLNGTDYDFDSKVTEDITLVAKWNGATSGDYSVTYNANGGSEVATGYANAGGTFAEPAAPTKAGFNFGGWYTDAELTQAYNFATAVSGNITLYAKWTSNAPYEPRWVLGQESQLGGQFDGKGMEIKIKVLPVSSYDPFDPNYTGTSQEIMKQHQRAVEAAYNVKIVYDAWGDDASWGPNRINNIKTGVSGNSYKENGIYVVNITSSWIPTLVKENCLAELYDVANDTGIFSEIGYNVDSEGNPDLTSIGYQQDETTSATTTVNNKVYGYVQGKARPDFFLYYNADLIAEAGMEDPATLWLRGEWTWPKFEAYVAELQTNLSAKGNNYYALAVRSAEFIIGSVASTGTSIATIQGRASLNLTSTDVTNRFLSIQGLYAKGYSDSDESDTPQSFLEARSAIVHGALWFIGASNRFDPAKCTFSIGAVPYPTAENQGGTPITTLNEDEAIMGYGNAPVETAQGSGVYIKGVDMSASTYKIPYDTTGCYSIINTENGTNGINNKKLFAIIYDLFEGLGDDPNEADVDSDTAYRNSIAAKFDYEVYADVIMSIQDKSYYVLITVLSMTVGGGSHYGTDAFYPLAKKICHDSSITPASQLNSVVQKYKDAMSSIGYTVA